MSSVTGVAEWFGQRAAKRGKSDVGRALPSEQSGTREQQEGHESGDRIAREAKKELVAEAAKNKGFAGADRDFPELQLAAFFLESAFDEIHFADRNAAGADDNVTFAKGSRESGAGGCESVRDERKDFGDTSGLVNQRSQSEPITFIDLGWGEVFAGLFEF